MVSFYKLMLCFAGAVLADDYQEHCTMWKSYGFDTMLIVDLYCTMLIMDLYCRQEA